MVSSVGSQGVGMAFTAVKHHIFRDLQDARDNPHLTTNQAFLELNGIDAALHDRYEAAIRRRDGNPEDMIEFVNSLTEEELNEKIYIDVGCRWVVGTYRQFKEKYLTEQALFERGKELAANCRDLNDMTDSTAVEFEYAMRLMKMVQMNMAEGLGLAKDYLRSLREPKDVVTLSAAAVKYLGERIDAFKG